VFIVLLKASSDQNIKSEYKVSGAPLDFSFLNLQEVAQLRKEVARSGNRKKIPESDDEEEMKKVSSYIFE
jgi:hypothetical protein